MISANPVKTHPFLKALGWIDSSYNPKNDEKELRITESLSQKYRVILKL